jgi:hypothetical protein
MASSNDKPGTNKNETVDPDDELVLASGHTVVALVHTVSVVTIILLTMGEPAEYQTGAVDVFLVVANWTVNKTEDSISVDSAVTSAGEFRTLWAALTFSITSLAFHWINAFAELDKNNVWTWVKRNDKWNPARWTDYALTSPLMLVTIAVLFGALDVATLVGVAALAAVTIVTGAFTEYTWYIDKISDFKNKNIWFNLVLAWSTFVASWTPLCIAFGEAQQVTDTKAPIPVIVWFSFLIAIFAGFGVYFMVSLYQTSRGARSYEIGWMTLSMCSKLTLHWFLYLAAKMRDEIRKGEENTNTPWPSIIAGFSILILSFGVAALIAYEWTKPMHKIVSFLGVAYFYYFVLFAFASAEIHHDNFQSAGILVVIPTTLHFIAGMTLFLRGVFSDQPGSHVLTERYDWTKPLGVLATVADVSIFVALVLGSVLIGDPDVSHAQYIGISAVTFGFIGNIFCFGNHLFSEKTQEIVYGKLMAAMF